MLYVDVNALNQLVGPIFNDFTGQQNVKVCYQYHWLNQFYICGV